MLRTAFSVALLLLLISASALAAPAYSLSDALLESGPLSAHSGGIPLLQDGGGDGAINVYGLSVDRGAIRSDFDFVDLGDLQYNGNPSRTLVYGSGNVAALGRNAHVTSFGGSAEGGPLLGVAVSQLPLPSSLGFSYSADSPLQFDAASPDSGRFSGSSIIGSDRVAKSYGVTGDGVTVAIVDTGTDFSNPDMQHAVARDENGVPIMIDADGQGIVLARAKYIAKIDEQTGRMLDAGYKPSSTLPEGMTSYVYLNDTEAVLLKTSDGEIPIYNTLYPFFETPVLNATARVDWVIGKSPTDYIRSASGVYRFGIIYQTQQHFGTLTFTLVPVLVVDSKEPGVYDTIIPDMYSAWYFYAHNELARLASGNEVDHLLLEPSFDFTDDAPIKIGAGNEFLTYDYDGDGFPDFSAGTVGARVVDLWQVIDDSEDAEPKLAHETGFGGVAVAKLLEPLDPGGEYFGVMYDLQGHGTSTAATVASKGLQEYDIYGNGTKYSLEGIAPGAKILPVKALWAGDSLYGWLYAAGYDLGDDGMWRYTGDHKADVISNSWGVASFPTMKYGLGYDILSVFSSLLSVPGLLSDDYPGTVMINSAGNNGVAYGSVGSPNVAPLTISVGSTTNNVHIGYSSFQNITRFGGSAESFDEISDFSSRGPGLFGDPKPELMATGSYAFTPTIVHLKNLQTTAEDSNSDSAFALFGGTSMAAPMVAGVATLVVEDLESQGREVIDPFEVKSIMMSSAKDLKNDPFVQGSGRVDAKAAVDLAEGKGNRFSAYTEDTVANVLSVMSGAISTYSNTLSVIDGGGDVAGKLDDMKFRESRWFAGHIEQGNSASTEIVIENPSGSEIEVEVSGLIEKLVARYEISNTTRLFEKDPVHNSTEYGYSPNYYDLSELGGIPENADLMVAKVTFPFASFMNTTEFFADQLKIASVYAYDWADADGDGNVTYTETVLVNRGGSWGTVQELRVADPAEKFKNAPVIGVYPVPSLLSFWGGDLMINSTAMNYTLAVEFYERQANPAIMIEDAPSATLTIPPQGTASVDATILTDRDALPGVYYGTVMVEGKLHSVLMPVSYVVASDPVPKDVPIVIAPPAGEPEAGLGLRPNGYVGGLSDMLSRYAAGDWRSYYFTVSDDTITSMSLKISWPHNTTSINAMAFDPSGRMVATSVPSGVFETFSGWPSNDWLGTTPFSEGGAFYFSQNSGDNSTLMFVPVNGTGVYSVLLHNTLFHGESMYEPVQLEAKFSTILPDRAAPVIRIDLPEYLDGIQSKIPVTVTDENLASWSYVVDAGIPIVPGVGSGDSFDLVLNNLAEGAHRLRIDSTDSVGRTSSFVSTFEVDRTPPSVEVFAQAPDGSSMRKPVSNNTVVTAEGNITLLWNVTDKNGIVLPSGITFDGSQQQVSKAFSDSITINPAEPEGESTFAIEAEDVAGNRVVQEIKVVFDKTPPATSLSLAGGTDAKGIAKIMLGAQDANLQSAMLSIGERKVVNVTGMTEYDLDTTELPDGKYELRFAAVDKAGNEGTTTATMTVSNTAPQIMSASLIGIVAGAGIASAAWFFIGRRRRV